MGFIDPFSDCQDYHYSKTSDAEEPREGYSFVFKSEGFDIKEIKEKGIVFGEDNLLGEPK